MNLTEREDFKKLCTVLVEISNIVGNKEKYSILSQPDETKKSYFLERANTTNFPNPIVEFDFTTPIELRRVLTDMWKYQGCTEMEILAGAFIVSALKSFSVDDVNYGIPVAVYTF